MRRKLGRNDPCWCGSGKKYKHCHLGHKEKRPLNIWQAEQQLSKIYSSKECLAPDALKSECSSVVKAHTVDRSGSLQQIARKGHVYNLTFTPSRMKESNGKSIPQLVGINVASTFSGFCKYHDNAIFSKIEDILFQASPEQCFLLAYRALARELFMKRAQVKSLSLMEKIIRDKPPPQQLFYREYMDPYAKGVRLGLRDVLHHKSLYDKTLLSGDFSKVQACVLELSRPPLVMCSAAVSPEYDFNKNELPNRIGVDIQQIPYYITFSSFCRGDKGFIVFTWLSDSELSCRMFIESLISIPHDRLTDALVRFFFEYSENLHISPDWWDNLTPEKQNALINKMTNSARFDWDRPSDCIAEDGISYAQWPIINIKTVGF